MSYSEARNHFEKGRNNTVDKSVVEMLDGLKHLSHALEEDIRTLEQAMGDIREIQNKQASTGPF
jgi:phage terminase small subunit